MAEASTTASTGTFNRRARSAALGVPSYRPITPSIKIRSATWAASARRARMSASPVIHRSTWCTGPLLARPCQNGSKKSGPHLNTRTRRPARVCRRASAAVTVDLPWPEAGAATSSTGQVDVLACMAAGTATVTQRPAQDSPTYAVRPALA